MLPKTMAKNSKLKSIAFYIIAYVFFFRGILVNALPYDYSAVIDCVAEPLAPQYNGGIIVNPEATDGLKGWTRFGDARIEPRSSLSGNKFIVALNRKQPYDSLSQQVILERDKLYTFSAWVQVSAKKNVTVTAVFKTSKGFENGGGVIANSGCWSMLKGGVSVDYSGLAQLYFQSDDTSVDIWVDSVSLQPFTTQEWRSQQDQSIEQVRKSMVKLQLVDTRGNPIPNTKISLQRGKLAFPFGVAINQNILKNNLYRNWFLQRFTVTTFENEMKWYSTERSRGKISYTISDAMLRFCTRYGIRVRGHNIFWNDPKYQPSWVYGLTRRELKACADRRINSIVPRYAGKLIGWDVNNENLHFNYFETKLGVNINKHFYKRTKILDPGTTLFINDYNTIEDNRDGLSIPSKYLEKVRELRGVLSFRAKIGIGVEGHFDRPNIPYMRSALDTLASTGLPIWITELDIRGPNQGRYLEDVLREAHAHPGVKGIVIWAGWSPQGCYRMCLTDNNFRNLETGNVVDKLLREWGGGGTVFGTTDGYGFFNGSLFHGDYSVGVGYEAVGLDDDSELVSSTSFRVVDGVDEQDFKVVV